MMPVYYPCMFATLSFIMTAINFPIINYEKVEMFHFQTRKVANTGKERLVMYTFTRDDNIEQQALKHLVITCTRALQTDFLFQK